MHIKNLFLLLIVLIFSACSTTRHYAYRDYNANASRTYSANKQDYTPKISQKVYSHPTMKPYVVRGVRYHPTTVSVGDRFRGNASWYGPNFHGKLTSNGERYNMWAMTAAHKTLPMNTIVKVTNLRNGKSTVVRINDRGPFVQTRIIDLSKAAASKINMIGHGTAPVELEILGFQNKGGTKIPTKKELKKAPQKRNITNFALQIASFSKIEGALKTQEEYDHIAGYRTIIKDVETVNGRMFKVILKGFKSEQEARDYKANSIFKKAFIVREDKQ